MRTVLFAAIASLAALANFSVAHANQPATPYEVENGCPAELPTYQAQPNANFTVLDRTTLSHECLTAMRDQNGDRDKNNDNNDD